MSALSRRVALRLRAFPGSSRLRDQDRGRGQALAEFAIILPVMLLVVGAALDFARLYQGWIALQSATRNAAESAASKSPDAASALTEARRIACAETRSIPGYLASGSSCSAPTVQIVSFARSTTATGASSSSPIATVTVRSTLPFQMLFSYPGLTTGSAWTITATETYEVAQNR